MRGLVRRHLWIALLLCSGAAFAASSPRSPLLGLDTSDLETELNNRYAAAVEASRSPAVTRSVGTAYTWAVQTKIVCGIAIGFLDSWTVDETSINRCDAFSARLQAGRMGRRSSGTTAGETTE